MLMASGGAAPLDTDGLIRGGGFIIFAMISSGDNDNMQYGSPRTTTSCMMMPNEYTSADWVPYLGKFFAPLMASGAAHNSSENGKCWIKVLNALGAVIWMDSRRFL